MPADTQRFPLTPHPQPTSPLERAAILTAPVFGMEFADYMARATWRKGEGWMGRGIVPLAPLAIHPAATALHYAQEVFEGLKAYRWADGSIRLFRPDRNAARFAASAERMALPTLDEGDFLAAIEALVRAVHEWVPTAPGASLYLRPFMFGAEPSLLVQPSSLVEFGVTASPVTAYHAAGTGGLAIWVPRGQSRAFEGGTGEAKTGGNYAASLLPTRDAYAHGCGQVLFLDAKHGRYIEEFGGMNVMAVTRGGDVITPRLSGTILRGITRASIIELWQDEGREVVERDIDIADLVAGVESGEITEVFGCGTAAVVSPVSRLVSEWFDVTVADGFAGPVTEGVRDRLTGIQFGTAEDTHGWMRRVL